MRLRINKTVSDFDLSCGNATMKYLKIVCLEPIKLSQIAQDCWIRAVLDALKWFHIWHRRNEEDQELSRMSEKSLREIGKFQDSWLPLPIQEDMCIKGLEILDANELYIDLPSFFFQCFWKPSFSHFNLPKTGKSLMMKKQGEVIVSETKCLNSAVPGTAYVPFEIWNAEPFLVSFRLCLTGLCLQFLYCAAKIRF